jgi:hypothetical protein
MEQNKWPTFQASNEYFEDVNLGFKISSKRNSHA